MRFVVGICLFLGLSTGALALYGWAFRADIQHYTADELIRLTCEEVSEKHEEVITAYHDAAIAHHRRTGAFPDDLGLPKDDVLPFAVLMQKFIADNDVTAFNPSAPFSITRQDQHRRFFNEISVICVTNPSMPAIEGVRQVAERLDLVKAMENP